MAAEADDMRYVFAEEIGKTIEVTPAAGSSSPLSAEALEPGRYVLRIIDFNGASDVWVRQGTAGTVTAAAAAPSMRFRAHTDVPKLNEPLMTFIVRPGGTKGSNGASNMLAFFPVGAVPTIQVTKISRGKN